MPSVFLAPARWLCLCAIVSVCAFTSPVSAVPPGKGDGAAAVKKMTMPKMAARKMMRIQPMVASPKRSLGLRLKVSKP